MGTSKRIKRITLAEQSARFVEAAKKAEADERLIAMDEAFKKISKKLRDKRRADDVGR
jgi:hypothetical protein